jgi:hypothetical protein
MDGDLDDTQNDLSSSTSSLATAGVTSASPSTSRNNHSAPNSPFNHSINSLNNSSLNSSMNISNQLPNVNVFTQRTLSYHSARERAVVPQGFFQWGIFLVAFPFKFLLSTFMDIATFFCKKKAVFSLKLTPNDVFI